MKKSKRLAERIRRVRVLFRELGYKIVDSEKKGPLYSASFENEEGFQAEVHLDEQCRFIELSFTFLFSVEMADFLKHRLEQMLKICYDYGCYINLEDADKEIGFSVFDKLYYAGLNYYSLRQSLKDFSECVDTLTGVLEITKEE
ncbi:MAG: hypothetical protein JW904_12135 [Spirochaetales bacterium]|nr:hypothetical protein [Spirochaetales bacterium]